MGGSRHGILQASAILFARHSGLSLEGAVSAAIADAEEDMNKRAVIAIGVVAPLINSTGPIFTFLSSAAWSSTMEGCGEVTKANVGTASKSSTHNAS